MKGNLLDVVSLISFVFVAIIAVFIFYQPTITMIQAMNNATPANLTVIETSVNTAYSNFDIMIPIFYIIALIASIVAASFIASHPAFFFILLFVNMLMMIFWSILYDMYSALAGLTSSASALSIMTYTPLLIEHMPKVNILGMMLIAIVQYLRGANQ